MPLGRSSNDVFHLLQTHSYQKRKKIVICTGLIFFHFVHYSVRLGVHIKIKVFQTVLPKCSEGWFVHPRVTKTKTLFKQQLFAILYFQPITHFTLTLNIFEWS